jgi:hypothetical protein
MDTVITSALSRMKDEEVDDTETITDSDSEDAVSEHGESAPIVRKDGTFWHRCRWTIAETTVLIRYFEKFCAMRSVESFGKEESILLVELIRQDYPEWRLGAPTDIICSRLYDIVRRLATSTSDYSILELGIIKRYSSVGRFVKVFSKLSAIPSIKARYPEDSQLQHLMSTDNITKSHAWSDSDTTILLREFHKFTDPETYHSPYFTMAQARELHIIIRTKYNNWRTDSNSKAMRRKLVRIAEMLATDRLDDTWLINKVTQHSSIERFRLFTNNSKRAHHRIAAANDDYRPRTAKRALVHAAAVDGSDPMMRQFIRPTPTMSQPITINIGQRPVTNRVAELVDASITTSPANMRAVVEDRGILEESRSSHPPSSSSSSKLTAAVSTTQNDTEIQASVLGLLREYHQRTIATSTAAFQRSLSLDDRSFADRISGVFHQNIRSMTQIIDELQRILYPSGPQ